jgi:hypothetical protein
VTRRERKRNLPEATFVAEIDKGFAFIIEDLAGREGPIEGFAHTSVRGFMTRLAGTLDPGWTPRGSVASSGL